MLQTTHLTKTFQAGNTTVNAVNDISFTIPTGQIAAIVGRSGSGKTTMLSLLGALDKPTSGKIEVDGQDITQLTDRHLIAYRARKIGFVFQSYNLVPNLTALDNVLLPMEFARAPQSSRRQRAIGLLQQVGITADQMKRKPSRLSGGQQQRVAIARALVNQPSLILADEPTGNLDSQTGSHIIALLRELSHKNNTTIVVVTHDTAVAKQADHVLRLQDGRLAKEDK